jgi:MoaA/NifB/PqqE/SkfB family radical SAM enzyme
MSRSTAWARPYAAVRGFDGFARADAAVRALRGVTPHVGINVVVTRANFAELPALFAYARRRRLAEVELLRWKPSGRGAAVYERLRCTDAQHRALLPTVLAAARKARIRVKLDCSYTPMIAHHDPGPQLLAQLAVYGCAGGDFLIGAKPTGAITACSFAAPPPPDGDRRPRVDDLAGYWRRPDAFGRFRTWRAAAEPCASCAYLTQCPRRLPGGERPRRRPGRPRSRVPAGGRSPARRCVWQRGPAGRPSLARGIERA